MAIGTGAAILGGAVIGGLASKSAASTQAAAAEQASQNQNAMFQQQVALQEPWRQAGIQALNKLAPMSDYTKFGMDQFQQDPGYAFRLSEGQKALERSAAARGGLMSGATGKNLLRYGQEMGSQEYQAAFNRYQAERAAQLQPLQALAGIGQTSANTLTNASAQNAAQQAENLYGAANGRASSYVGAANAAQQGIGQYLNYSQSQNLLGLLGRGQGNALNAG